MPVFVRPAPTIRVSPQLSLKGGERLRLGVDQVHADSPSKGCSLFRRLRIGAGFAAHPALTRVSGHFVRRACLPVTYYTEREGAIISSTPPMRHVWWTAFDSCQVR